MVNAVALMCRAGPAMVCLHRAATEPLPDAAAVRAAYATVAAVNREWFGRPMTPAEHVEALCDVDAAARAVQGGGVESSLLACWDEDPAACFGPTAIIEGHRLRWEERRERCA